MTDQPTPRKPLRLWPGVVAVLLQWLGVFVVPRITSGEVAMFASLIGAGVGALAFIVWWLLLSRAPWSERLIAIALIPGALFATYCLVDVSIRTAGMGFLFFFFAIPVLSLGVVVWAAACGRLSGGLRRSTMVLSILLCCGVFMLLRTNGITGGGRSDLRWRWTRTNEEKLLAQPATEPKALASIPAPQEKHAQWPGFRGPDRDGIVRGVQIQTNWSASPPVQVWRRPIGPGWSSFAVGGDLLFTQEQRGNDEIVACYKLTTGEPVWRHGDAVRFWESNAGAGPRATPTLSNGRLYTFGATGILNALDAGNGTLLWSRSVASDIGRKAPTWGFSSSPLVVDDLVIVAASGTLVAYDLARGHRRWTGPTNTGSYSSPHQATLGGVAQVLLLSGVGVTSVAPANGAVLWEHPWPGFTIVQPALTQDGDVLISTSSASGGIGTRRLAVAHNPGGWTVQERWTSKGLKPYFNDLVVHKRCAFGFDGNILACIDLVDGHRKWKDGRYGNGQLILLPDQDLLVVLSEEGELALVGATPQAFGELARFPAIKGKTWNHPALVGDLLLVRNGQEMAAFRL